MSKNRTAGDSPLIALNNSAENKNVTPGTTAIPQKQAGCGQIIFIADSYQDYTEWKFALENYVV